MKNHGNGGFLSHRGAPKSFILFSDAPLNDVYLETPSLLLKSVGKSALNMGKVGVLEGNVITWVSLQ